MKPLTPPFRLGKKQKRAVLDKYGNEVVIFPKGKEKQAAEYVEVINKHNEKLLGIIMGELIDLYYAAFDYPNGKSQEKIDKCNETCKEYIEIIGLDFVKSIDLAELNKFAYENIRQIGLVKNEIKESKIIILLAYMCVFYPNRLRNNEQIDEDIIREITHCLGYAFDINS